MTPPLAAAHPPARRSIVKGAAWALPAVTVAAAAPVAAASPSCVTAIGASVCASGFLPVTYTYSVDLQNTCATSVTVTVTVTASLSSGGSDSSGAQTETIAAGGTARISGSYPSLFGLTTVTSIAVSGDVVDSFSAPFACTAGPTGRGRAAQELSRPSDEEIRAYLAANPELLEQEEVKAALREHPEWDPRTSKSAEEPSVQESAQTEQLKETAPSQDEPKVAPEKPSAPSQEQPSVAPEQAAPDAESS